MTQTAPRKIGDKVAEPYQARIATAVGGAISTGKSGAVLAPTGSGKSLLVTFGVEDAIAVGKPVLVLQPDVHLLQQNFELFGHSTAIRGALIGAFIAQNDRIPGKFTRNSLDVDVCIATNMSLVNKASDPAFQRELKAFGARGGVVLVDEGQNAAADELSQILKTIAQAGGSGIIYTATPFRTDGRDILEPFGASIEQDLIEVAGYDEVMATGRTVATRFDIATSEFEGLIGAEAANLIEEQFLHLLGQNKSIDQASKLAFSRFFKPDASPADQTIADLIVYAVGEIWRRRAHNHTLAMIHCDSVEFARTLAASISQTPLPAGHSRAGRLPSVAYVVASETLVWHEGECSNTIDGKKARRSTILTAARDHAYDVLVNVNALGTGTDVPQTDLNIIAAQERSIGPLKQNSGRGERTSPDTGKKHQTFTDIGNSIYRVFNDIDAMRRNDPDRARRQIRGLAAPIRAQFEAWFETDPDLQKSVEARTRQIRTRRGGAADAHEVGELLDPTMEFGLDNELPIAHPFSKGIYAAGNRRYNSETKQYTGRTAIFVDLVTVGLLPSENASEAPRWLAVTHDSKLDTQQAFVAKDLDTARKFAAFVGIRFDNEFENTAPSGAQFKFATDLQSKHNRQQDLISGYARPTSRTQVATIIELLNFEGGLLGKMLNAGATRFIQRATGARHVHPELRSIVLHNPNSLSGAQRDMLAAYCRLRHHLPAIYRAKFAANDRFSVATYDPSTLPEIRDILSGTRFKLFVVDTPAQEQQLKDRLLAGLVDARIIAMAPDSTGEMWIRRKAGMPAIATPKAQAVSREREEEFAAALFSMTDGPHARKSGVISIAMTRPECVEVARAAPEIDLPAPIANLIKKLIELVAMPPVFTDAEELPHMEIIVDTITNMKPGAEVKFKIQNLAAKFAGLPLAAQKKLIKVTERAADLDHKRMEYNSKTQNLRRTAQR